MRFLLSGMFWGMVPDHGMGWRWNRGRQGSVGNARERWALEDWNDVFVYLIFRNGV